ncbi:hypothetical protein FN846DRAFT_987190 [Sphaerosporella brunnea]|uniref:Uncharacterized protein n=1 Tax=Sphaerosporella brunnea TaxID=1250544 RepID=A0A5J5ESW7_9PEZI|nr:hypothetical protein FN846DRAFT_987186 [Sphaerosporella brunnea]KAA8902042.1 hypothetical protein FN846DRAFT_987190 [Sphaerosporella brunnea]
MEGLESTVDSIDQVLTGEGFSASAGGEDSTAAAADPVSTEAAREEANPAGLFERMAFAETMMTHIERHHARLLPGASGKGEAMVLEDNSDLDVDEDGGNLLRHAMVYALAKKLQMPELKHLAHRKTLRIRSTAKSELRYARFAYQNTTKEDRAIRRLRRKKVREQQINEFVLQFANVQARGRVKQSDPAFAARGIAEKQAEAKTQRSGQKRKHRQHDDVSDMSLYEAVESSVTVSDWVGPLDVFMEFWRSRDGEPDVDGSRMQILPAPDADANAAIRITDLIASPIGPDDREWPFDIAAYRTTWRGRCDKHEAEDDLFKTEFNSDREDDETDGETTALSGIASGDVIPGGDATLERTRRSKRLKRDVSLEE